MLTLLKIPIKIRSKDFFLENLAYYHSGHISSLPALHTKHINIEIYYKFEVTRCFYGCGPVL